MKTPNKYKTEAQKKEEKREARRQEIRYIVQNPHYLAALRARNLKKYGW